MTIDIATIERRGRRRRVRLVDPARGPVRAVALGAGVDVMTFLASLAGERMFFDGDNPPGSAATCAARPRSPRARRRTGRWATRSPRTSVNARGLRRAPSPSRTAPTERCSTASSGKRVEAKLGELYERTWALLEENRAEVLAVAHALETAQDDHGRRRGGHHRGTRGLARGRRPYHEPAFRETPRGVSRGRPGRPPGARRGRGRDPRADAARAVEELDVGGSTAAIGPGARGRRPVILTA